MGAAGNWAVPIAQPAPARPGTEAVLPCSAGAPLQLRRTSRRVAIWACRQPVTRRQGCQGQRPAARIWGQAGLEAERGDPAACNEGTGSLGG